MIMAVTGSRCSSDGSTTSSRERCSDRASDSLSPAAREVDTPHAVLVLMPAVSDTDRVVPHDAPACGRARPVPVERDSLSDEDAAAETESPTVLVYDPPMVSVTDSPTVSVSWESTNR